MKIATISTDGKAKNTLPIMRSMVERYYMDVAEYASLSLPEMFQLVKNIPYREDPQDREVLMRPLYTLTGTGYGGDCDDKAIVMGSWAKLNGYPFRFKAVRNRGYSALNHVYTQILINGRWVTVDPTYQFNHLDNSAPEIEYIYG